MTLEIRKAGIPELYPWDWITVRCEHGGVDDEVHTNATPIQRARKIEMLIFELQGRRGCKCGMDIWERYCLRSPPLSVLESP